MVQNLGTLRCNSTQAGLRRMWAKTRIADKFGTTPDEALSWAQMLIQFSPGSDYALTPEQEEWWGRFMEATAR